MSDTDAEADRPSYETNDHNLLSDISHGLRCVNRGLDRIYAKIEEIERGNVDYEIRTNRALLRLALSYTGWDFYVARIDDNVMRLPDQPDDCKGNLKWAIAALTAKGEKPAYHNAIKWGEKALNITDDDKQKWHCLYVRHFARWRIGGLRLLWALCDIRKMEKIDPAKSDSYRIWRGEIYSKMKSQALSVIAKGIGLVLALVPALVAAIALAEWLLS